MRKLLRLCFLSFRRIRRMENAFVTCVGVTLVVYVILISDVIPSFTAFKPQSVQRLDFPEPPSSTRELHAARLQPGLHTPSPHPPSPNNDDDDDDDDASPSKGVRPATTTTTSHRFSPPTLPPQQRQRHQHGGQNKSVPTAAGWVQTPAPLLSPNKDRPTGGGGGDEGDGGGDQGGKGKGKPPAPVNVTSPPSVLLAGVPRARKVFLTVGMVTVKRDKADYFLGTMASLLQHSSPDEQRDLTIVVMLADRDQDHNQRVLRQLQDRYPAQLTSGLLLVVRGPRTDFIFAKADVKRTYDDSLPRVQWRSKQNLDYAALMEFSSDLSRYYLHLEDDVLTAESYVRLLDEFVRGQKSPWAMLELSPHGFIGKLFKSPDLPQLVMLLRTFYLEQPCDFLIDYFMRMMTQPKRIVRSGALFFHQGKFSSLTNVTRKVDKAPASKPDGKVKDVVKTLTNKMNPEAQVASNLTIYSHHGVYNPYSPQVDAFLWASQVKEGQRYTVTFTSMQRVKKVVIETGFSAEKRSDILYNGRVEMGTEEPVVSQPLACPHAKTVGAFRHGHFDVTLEPPHDVRCFSVVVAKDQKEWLIIRDLLVVTG